MDTLASLRTNIQRLNPLINQLESINQQIGTTKDSNELRQKVINIQSNARNVINEAQKNLKTLGTTPLKNDLKIQKERLCDELVKLVRKFQVLTQETLAKEKEVEGSKFDNNSTRIVMGEDDMSMKFSRQEQENSQYQKQMQAQKAVEFEQTKERKKQFDQLESDIKDLNSMFKDIAVIVHDQQETIDAIESNIETTTYAVEGATDHLKEAITYQSKSRRKKFLIIIIIIVVLLVLAGVVVLSLKPWNW